MAINALFFACLALILEWVRITNTSLILTARDVLLDPKSIIKSAFNARDFIHTISKVGTAIEIVTHTTSATLLDALKSLLLYYVLFTFVLRAYFHVRARGLCSCIRTFARTFAGVRFTPIVVMIANAP